MRNSLFFLAIFVLILGAAAFIQYGRNSHMAHPIPDMPASVVEKAASPEPEGGVETATFGGGCFWCTEAIFQRVKGVKSVLPGYSGGQLINPTYRQVCSGETGHAEAIQLTFDPAVVPYSEILKIFWETHDPTTLNRQGHDRGTQYRSVIFWHTDRQKQVAEEYKQLIDQSGVFDSPVVTEIAPFEKFYIAEDYHQNYYADNSREPYCQAVIRPKLDKLEKLFHDKLKVSPK